MCSSGEKGAFVGERGGTVAKNKTQPGEVLLRCSREQEVFRKKREPACDAGSWGRRPGRFRAGHLFGRTVSEHHVELNGCGHLELACGGRKGGGGGERRGRAANAANRGGQERRIDRERNLVPFRLKTEHRNLSWLREKASRHHLQEEKKGRGGEISGKDYRGRTGGLSGGIQHLILLVGNISMGERGAKFL